MNCIILKGSGEKAFCAGGDVKGVVQQIMRGEQDEAIRHANAPCCLAPSCSKRFVACCVYRNSPHLFDLPFCHNCADCLLLLAKDVPTEFVKSSEMRKCPFI